MSTTRIDALGVVVPVRRDAENAQRTATSLLAAADAVGLPVRIAICDNGENGDLAVLLPADRRLGVEVVEEAGPGFARSAGAGALERWAATNGLDPARTWLVSLDADVALSEDFLLRWHAEIEGSGADVLAGPVHFAALEGDVELRGDVEVASGWMWGDTALYEHLAGFVNVGGCNHAVTLATCATNDYYLQPSAEMDGKRRIVAGDDWDFGLRAAMTGFSVARATGPLVRTSNRRIAADPVGFLAGRSYERPFVPVRERPEATTWPPEEAWATVSACGRARLVAHFLAKPLLAGLPASASIAWFLGPELTVELDELVGRAPRLEGDWNTFRGRLIGLLFEEEPFSLFGRIASHIGGGH